VGVAVFGGAQGAERADEAEHPWEITIGAALLIISSLCLCAPPPFHWLSSVMIHITFRDIRILSCTAGYCVNSKVAYLHLTL
jgi:hypothetical protein